MKWIETSQTWGLSGVCTGKESMDEIKREIGQTSKMTGDVVSFCTSCATVLPLACETEIVCAFPSNVYIAKMVIKRFWVRKRLRTLKPKTNVF